MAKSAGNFLPDYQADDPPVDQRRTKPAAVRELLDDRVGQMLDGPIEENEIVGRAASKSGIGS
jgi:hypothetical protein